MGWRFVRQPNGLLGRFSDVVDDFTIYNMTAEEAFKESRGAGLSPFVALQKVQRGVEDYAPWTNDPSNHPARLSRWEDSIHTIRVIHGASRAEEAIREGSRPSACVDTLDASFRHLADRICPPER